MLTANNTARAADSNGFQKMFCAGPFDNARRLLPHRGVPGRRADDARPGTPCPPRRRAGLRRALGARRAAARPELRRPRAGLRPLGLSRLDRGADAHDRARHRLDRPAPAPPAAYGQGGGLGRPALGRPARARRRVRRPTGRVPGLRRRHGPGAMSSSARTSASSARCSPRSSRRSDRPTARCPGTADLVPKPVGRLPMLVTGAAGRAWNGSPSMPTAGSPTRGPRSAGGSSPRAGAAPWRPPRRAPSSRSPNRSTSTSADDPDRPPTPIHLGFRGGRNFVFRFLDALRAAGVHHVILNFKYGVARRGRGPRRDRPGDPAATCYQPTDAGDTGRLRYCRTRSSCLSSLSGVP